MIKVWADGGCSENPGGHIASGIYITTDNDEEIVRFGKYHGKGTNNEAEYHAAIEALNWLLLKGYKETTIQVFMDSKLIVMQFNGKWKCKKQHLAILNRQLKGIANHFTNEIVFTWISRDFNEIADEEATKILEEQALMETFKKC